MAHTIKKPSFWSEKLLDKLNGINVGLNFVNPALEDESRILEAGDSVRVITSGAVTVGEYTSYSDISLGDITDVEETLSVNKKFFWAFPCDDVDATQSQPGKIQKYMEDGAVGLNRKIDAYILGQYASAATANKITGASSAALKIDANPPYELLVDAGIRLTKQGAPLDSRWAVVTPEFYGQCLKDKDYFIQGSALGDTILSTARVINGTPGTALSTPGFVGRIAGFDVFVSTNLTESAADSGKFFCVYGQSRPIDFVSQLNKVEIIPLALQFGFVAKGLCLCGAKVFAENSKRLGSIFIDHAATA